MNLLMLGVNHHTSELDVRERLALNGERCEQVVSTLREGNPSVEVVVLSTCNRTEIYRACDRADDFDPNSLHRIWANVCGVNADRIAADSTVIRGEAAVRHLFRVASGLESMVLGEPQVLGQVKSAYRAAEQYRTLGPVLHRVFQQAIAASKQARSVTGIDSGRVSIGSIAVDFAKRIFERFDDKTVVAIGAGQAAKLTLRHLAKIQPGRLWMVNRSVQRARDLAASLQLTGGEEMFRKFHDLDDLLIDADIVLTGTSSNEPILTRSRLEPLADLRRHRPIYMIDTAVPRDVEPSVGEIDNVYLYNIDDLQSVAKQTHEERTGHAGKCEAMIEDAVRKCLFDVRHSELGRVIRQLRHNLHTLGDAETERTRRKLIALGGDEQRGELDEVLSDHTRRLINKILHLPLSRLDHDRGDDSLAFYAAALRELFEVQPNGEALECDIDRVERADDAAGMPTSVSSDTRPEVNVTLSPLRDKANVG